MKKPSVPLGLVFSRSGPYEMMAGEMLKSASMAVDEVNQSDEFDFTFAPHLRDPGGVVAAYHTACADLIREEGVEHIVGCYTSASRKQVIPVVERTDRLLWHPARYEGFECSDNVIYVGAAPNHTVVAAGAAYAGSHPRRGVRHRLQLRLDLGNQPGHSRDRHRHGRPDPCRAPAGAWRVRGRSHRQGDRRSKAAGGVQHPGRRIQLRLY